MACNRPAKRRSVFLVCLGCLVVIAPIAAVHTLPAAAEGHPAESTDRESRSPREKLESLPPAEKAELSRKCDRFYRLAPEVQQRLRDLHHSLENCPDGEHLRGVMERYTQWLKTLPSGQRSELLSLPPKERIAEIRRLMEERERSQMRHFIPTELTDEDLQAIGDWLDEFIEQHEAELIEAVPRFRERIKAMHDAQKRRLLLYVALRMSPQKDLFKPSKEEIERLEGQLSADAQKKLQDSRREGTLGELAQRWMRAALYSKHLSPPVSREELSKFFHEVLDARQREYLESLPRQRMEFELSRMFQANRARELFGDLFPGGFGRSGGSRGRGGGSHGFPDGSRRGGPPPRRPENE